MVKDQWDNEDTKSVNEEDAAPVRLGGPRRKFDDEEEDDVLDSWDAEESDSEVESKAQAAAEAKAKAEAEAAANKKSKKERIAEHQAERARRRAEDEAESEDDETEAERRERLRRSEKEADLAHAEDLFGDVGANVGVGRKAPVAATARVVPIDAANPEGNTLDLAALPLFNPTTKPQFDALRTTLAPILASSAPKKTNYSLFVQEFCRELARELPSEQIRKIASSLTALSNEKMREEKAADKSAKKTKAQKTKATLVAGRVNEPDLRSYDDDGLGDDDFM